MMLWSDVHGYYGGLEMQAPLLIYFVGMKFFSASFLLICSEAA